MANSREIRAWLREQNIDVPSGGPLSLEYRQMYNEAHMEGGPPEADLMDHAPEPVEEVAPKVSDKGQPVIGRVVNRARKATNGARTRGKKVARKSLASVLSMGYEWLSVPAASVSKPVAYMMQVQAPVVGEVLDGPIAGTIIDKLLQPLATVNEALEPVNAVITPLVGAFLLDRFPQHADKILPKMRNGLHAWAKVAGPHYEKIQAEEKVFEEEYGDGIDEVLEKLLAVVQLSHEQRNSQEWG